MSTEEVESPWGETVQLKFIDNNVLDVPLDVLRNAQTLPVISRMFSKENEKMLLCNKYISMNTFSYMFFPIACRLMRPMIPWSDVPKGITRAEWNSELDFWGYNENDVQTPALKKRKIDVTLNGEREKYSKQVIYHFVEWIKSGSDFTEAMLTEKDFELHILPTTLLKVNRPCNLVKKLEVNKPMNIKIGKWLYENVQFVKEYILELTSAKCVNVLFVAKKKKKKDVVEKVLWPASLELGETRDVTTTALYRVVFDFV